MSVYNTLSDHLSAAVAAMHAGNTASSSQLAGLDSGDDESDGLEDLPTGSGIAPHASSSGSHNGKFV